MLTLVASCDGLAMKEIEKNTHMDKIEKTTMLENGKLPPSWWEVIEIKTYKLQPKSFKGLSFTPFESKNHEQNKVLYLM